MCTKRLIVFLAVCFVTVFGMLSVHAADSYELLSPDGSVSVQISLDENGGLTYSVAKDGKAVLDNGTVGLTTESGDFTGGLTLIGTTESVINETVPMTSGSYKEIQNYANELTLTFENGYSVIFRAYNDGAAFRQCLDGSGRVEVSKDASTLTIPAQANTWAMKTDNTSNAYSTAYTNAVAESMSGMYYFPVMYQTVDGVWCLITEANLFDSDFAGCVLSKGENNSFSLEFAAYQNGADVWINAPGTTPWRTVICGDLATMVENTMVDALTAKADGDFSYVETGVSAWSWLNDGSPRQDEVPLLKRYIDLAHEMKWEYFILDEGWQPHSQNYTYDSRTYDGFPDWLPEIMEYAKERDVKLIAWLNRRAVDTASEVDFLEEIKTAGFAGIKVDFFDSESSAIVVYYNRILQKCAELGLVVNIHGTNKPTGERMTYPNIIAKEAVHGDEAMKTKAMYTTLIPFTRGSLGSTDFLDNDKYNVAIYTDEENGDGKVIYMSVTAGEAITVDLVKNGGAAIKIVPESDIPLLAFEKATVQLAVGEEQTVPLALPDTYFPDIVWTSSDENVATVKNGHIIGILSGKVTVTAASAADENIKAELSVHVFGGRKIAEGWTVKNEAENFGERAITDNANPYKLTMTTGVGYVGVKESAEPENMWMIDAPEGDFTVTVKVSGILTHSYSSCLVGVYAGGVSVVQMSRRFHPSLGEKAGAPASKLGTVGNVFDFYTYTTKYVEKYCADNNFDKPAWIRITREGDIFRGYYSYDGKTFTEMSGTLSHDGITNADSLKIVIACQMGGNSTFKNEIVFEDFTVNGEKIPFTKENPYNTGEVCLVDVLCALQYKLHNTVLLAADVDHSGKIDLLDILKLLKLAVK